MSREMDSLETPTDALIAATELADNFSDVLIIGLTKDSSYVLMTNANALSTKIGMSVIAFETFRKGVREDE